VALAAEKGHVEAQIILGMYVVVTYMYHRYDGEGVPEDKAEAIKWWRLAANKAM
jgi:TPR repeat protein